MQPKCDLLTRCDSANTNNTIDKIKPKFIFKKTDQRLILLCFLIFFVELTLIRWISANIFLLAFFSNFVLLASFIGMGVGFLRLKSSFRLFYFSPILLTLVISFCYYFQYQYHVNVDMVSDDLSYYGVLFKENLFPIGLSLPIIFALVIVVMTSIADGIARAFTLLQPLHAYRLDILGSLLGIITFSLMAYFNVSPVGWGVIISAIYIYLAFDDSHLNKFRRFLLLVVLILMNFVLAKASFQGNNQWSPYYKITTQSYTHGRYVVNVNGLPQQFIESVAQRKKYKPFYFYGYQHRVSNTPLENVLVVGAGTGGDVAIALAQGAKHVDAIEIDRLIYELGKSLNPNHVYDDPRVHIYIEDGRAFLQQTNKLYDMILFALPDSVMILSGQSSLRLENYLFTTEAITAMQRHLQSNGIFTMYNYYRDRWLVDRLANTLQLVFKHAPCIDTEGEKNHWLSALTISTRSSNLQCPIKWHPVINSSAKPSTDDHPFLYLQNASIPPLYITAIIFVLVIAGLSFLLAGASLRTIGNYPDLFMMGVAFLLLETKNIVNFALYFGSTWSVNALVFMGILFTVYLAIEITHHCKRVNISLLYVILLISLFCVWFIPSSYLLTLPGLLRFIVATILAFVPILVANIIFAERFSHTKHSTEALGVNLMGAVLGGLMEYSSLIIGYRNLIILVAVLYTLAIIFLKLKTNKVVIA